MLRNRDQSKDRGASLILLTLALMLLLGTAAVAIDLAALRLDIRADRLATDASVTAAVAQISPFNASGTQQACQTAWDYALVNLEDEGAVITPPDCTVFAGTCDPAVTRQTTGDAPPYSITITQPVPDDDPLMGSQDLDPQIDGVACQRIAVTIERVREHRFAQLIGFDSGTTEVTSVARSATEPGEDEIVPLLLLDPIGCEALFTSGQGKVTVSYNDTTDTPGIIIVDSDGSDCGAPNPYSIDSMGNQKGWIRAIPVPGEDIPSAILSYAQSGIGSANPSASYDPGDLTDPVNPADITDLTEPAISWFRLYPKPTPTYERITRAPIDWRYNCKSGYPVYPLDLGDPGLGGIEVADCPFPSAPYIDNHIASYGSGNPAGYQIWSIDGPYPCDVGAMVITVSGNWLVDCPSGLIVNGGTVTFDGNVIFTGGIDLRSDSTMVVNSANTSDVFIYLRSGTILKRAQSSLTLNRTFAYLANGAVDLRAGDGGLTWTAPTGGNFEDLALWSEAALVHAIGGQAGNTLTGTFFTPLAEPFSLTGQAGQFQFQAQFITRRLEVKGQGEVKMTPDPDKTTPIPARAVKLIR